MKVTPGKSSTSRREFLRTRARTGSPRSDISLTKIRPMELVPPVTNMVMKIRSYYSVDVFGY
jgi:hypothetical protein